jgi:hypothetical protein
LKFFAFGYIRVLFGFWETEGKKKDRYSEVSYAFFSSFLFLLNLLHLVFVAWYGIRFRSCLLHVQIYLRFNLKSDILLVYRDVVVVKLGHNPKNWNFISNSTLCDKVKASRTVENLIGFTVSYLIQTELLSFELSKFIYVLVYRSSFDLFR